MSVDLTTAELDRLYEGSKDDRYIVVGSEVRQMIGMIRRRDDRIEALEAALRQIELLVTNRPENKATARIARAALARE